MSVSSLFSIPLFSPLPLASKMLEPCSIAISVKLSSRNPHTLKVSCNYCCFEIEDRRKRKCQSWPWSMLEFQELKLGASEFLDVSYRPPGTQDNLLKGVNLSLPEKSFGLVFGRSGSGKTTLLQLLAGLNTPTAGSIYLQRYGNDGQPIQFPELLPPERVGIVFQFPERYFLADTVLDEVTFGWPRQKGGLPLKEQLALRLQTAINWVGLSGISLDIDPHSLSGGYKRRLALAIQLVQIPDLLLLDEPLAGLDWKARMDVVKLLKHLKKKLTILVVSHDLKELSSLVDRSWRMEMGGVLKEEPLPV